MRWVRQTSYVATQKSSLHATREENSDSGNDEAAVGRGRCIHGLGLDSDASVDLVAPSIGPSRTYPSALERDSISVSLPVVEPRVKDEPRAGVR